MTINYQSGKHHSPLMYVQYITGKNWDNDSIILICVIFCQQGSITTSTFCFLFSIHYMNAQKEKKKKCIPM